MVQVSVAPLSFSEYPCLGAPANSTKPSDTPRADLGPRPGAHAPETRTSHWASTGRPRRRRTLASRLQGADMPCRFEGHAARSSHPPVRTQEHRMHPARRARTCLPAPPPGTLRHSRSDQAAIGDPWARRHPKYAGSPLFRGRRVTTASLDCRTTTSPAATHRGLASTSSTPPTAAAAASAMGMISRRSTITSALSSSEGGGAPFPFVHPAQSGTVERKRPGGDPALVNEGWHADPPGGIAGPDGTHEQLVLVWSSTPAADKRDAARVPQQDGVADEGGRSHTSRPVEVASSGIPQLEVVGDVLAPH